MAARRGSWLANLALLGLAVVASALLAELAVRVVLGPQVRFPRRVVGAPWGLRFNEPGAEYRHHSPDVDVSFRINEQGMRAPRDYPYEKPPGTRRIVSLGDSFTVGYEVEGDETFSAVLERELRARGVRAEVLNAGVSGFGTAEEVLYLERELWKYDPDLVLLSYFPNDLLDSVRSNLFVWSEGRLAPAAESYVPAGGLGDFLNTNPLMSFLAERSDAFAFAKEGLNRLIKQRLVEANREAVDRAAEGPAAGAGEPYEEALAVALLERLYAGTRERGVPLVIQSIPSYTPEPPTLVDGFPKGFAPEREGLAFVAAKPLLEPSLGREPLYNTRSHWHWTPLAHRLSGQALAERIEQEGFLRGAAGSAQAGAGAVPETRSGSFRP
jgi:lysophospholipase L1-like esterase